MRSSIVLSIPFLCFAASAIDLNTIPIPGVTELDAGCAAQAVLDTCISSTTAIATSCSLTDYACLCQKNTDILTCFNNCPNDPRLAGVRSTQASYCANASAYPSSTAIVPSNTLSSSMANVPTSSSLSSASASSSSMSMSMTMTHSSSMDMKPTGSSTSTSESASPTETEKSGSNRNYVSQFAMLIAIIVVIL